MARTPLPLSFTHGAALAHAADLRADAERHRLARIALQPRRRPSPARAAGALRDSLAEALTARAGRAGAAACPTC